MVASTPWAIVLAGGAGDTLVGMNVAGCSALTVTFAASSSSARSKAFMICASLDCR